MWNMFTTSSLLLILAVVCQAQLHQVTLNRADPAFQMLTLANGQRVRVFPIPIRQSRILHFKARKDGRLFRARPEDINTEKQSAFEPVSKSYKIEKEDFKRNVNVEDATQKPKVEEKPTIPPYLGTSSKAYGDFLVPMHHKKEVVEEDVLTGDGSGSGEESEVRSSTDEELLTTMEADEIKTTVAPKREEKSAFPQPKSSLPKDHVVEHIHSDVHHEVSHSPKMEPILKINDKRVKIPKMIIPDSSVQTTEAHIRPNATVDEIKQKIRKLNQQLVEIQTYVEEHPWKRRRARVHGATTFHGDALSSAIPFQRDAPQGQITALLTMPNGEVQSVLLNADDVSQISSDSTDREPFYRQGERPYYKENGLPTMASVPYSPLNGLQIPRSINLQGFPQSATYPGLQYSQPLAYGIPSGSTDMGSFQRSPYGLNGGSPTYPNLSPNEPLPEKLDIPGCYVNEKGFVCCNKQLESLIATAMSDISIKERKREKEIGKSTCNLQAAANQLQKQAEDVFGVSFESLISPTDFASRTRFTDDLMCKTEVNGRYVILYATPVPYPIGKRRL